MGVPILVIVVGLAAGIAVARRWLPPIGAEPIGVLTSWVVGVLLGAAIAVVGLQAYHLARALDDDSSGVFTDSDSEAVAFYGEKALIYGGILLGLATVVYLAAMRVHGGDRRQ